MSDVWDGFKMEYYINTQVHTRMKETVKTISILATPPFYIPS